MSVFDWLRGEFAKFGLAPLPLHDADFPDEPSATVTRLADRVRPADTSPTGASPGTGHGDGPAAPASPGAAGIHPSQWPAGDYETVGREYLAKLYNLMTQLGDLCADVVELIEHADPTPTGLASANKRKGRSPRE